MTDPENRFHALKFAITTCGNAAPRDVVVTAHLYLAFLEGLTELNMASPQDVAEPEPAADEPVELADHTESYADEPVNEDRATPGWVDVGPEAETLQALDADNRAMIDAIIGQLDDNPERELSAVAIMAREQAAMSSEEWAKHHEFYHTRYGLQKGQITEPVLETSVAEKPQAVTADDQ